VPRALRRQVRRRRGQPPLHGPQLEPQGGFHGRGAPQRLVVLAGPLGEALPPRRHLVPQLLALARVALDLGPREGRLHVGRVRHGGLRALRRRGAGLHGGHGRGGRRRLFRACRLLGPPPLGGRRQLRLQVLPLWT
jgi:hypothetical protein